MHTPTRADLLTGLRSTSHWDMVIIGGGATGLGVAVDAASRGYKVALVEAEDFAKGTSSRATKLLHGGVRYLAQGNISLVREALQERTTLLQNAPHLAQPLPFVMPAYRWWERLFYGTGLMLYDLLAGSAGLGQTQFLSPAQTQALIPGAQTHGLRGGVKYWDGQFDDARLAIALARTAQQQGACVINHCKAVRLLQAQAPAGKALAGIVVQDQESGETFELRSTCVINATGVWVDGLRHMEDPQSKPLVSPSQGVHLVVDSTFMPGDHAMLIPRTADGRVLFAVPWMGKLILGTTDTPTDHLLLEPQAFEAEIEFILTESARYLKRAPLRADVRSVWVGLRPLVNDTAHAENTKSLSREHTLAIGPLGLLTVTGGKWTTYRRMAQDVMTHCLNAGLIQTRPTSSPGSSSSNTLHLPLVGSPTVPNELGSPVYTAISAAPGLHLYGSDAAMVQSLPGAQRQLATGLSEAMVRFAVRHESARTVEDVLARRSRLLFLDAKAAIAIADEVARIMQDEWSGLLDSRSTAFDPQRSAQAFKNLARSYLLI